MTWSSAIILTISWPCLHCVFTMSWPKTFVGKCKTLWHHIEKWPWHGQDIIKTSAFEQLKIAFDIYYCYISCCSQNYWEANGGNQIYFSLTAFPRIGPLLVLHSIYCHLFYFGRIMLGCMMLYKMDNICTLWVCRQKVVCSPMRTINC